MPWSCPPTGGAGDGQRRLGSRVKVGIAVLAAVLLLGGAWLWVRDSSLVAVRRVSIAGVYGPDAGQIRSALRLAALNMTTLDVRQGQLRMAVAPYPIVKDLHVSTQFPHGMRIDVVEQLPLGALVAGRQADRGQRRRDAPARCARRSRCRRSRWPRFRAARR